jgi:VanZ family protein
MNGNPEHERTVVSPEQRNLEFPLLWQGVGWLMVVLVVILSLLPHPPTPPIVTWDKSQHLLAYGGLMYWFGMVFPRYVSWVLFLMALGVILEVLQGWSGYRYFEYADMLANTLGVFVGLLLATTQLGGLVGGLDRLLAVWMGREARS